MVNRDIKNAIKANACDLAPLKQMNIQSELKNELLKFFYGAKDTDEAVRVILEIFAKRPPSHESFNQVQDLRSYLLHHPNSEMITTSCLHFLGDEAQQWWAEKHRIV